MNPDQPAGRRGQYRTTSAYELDARTLLLRGGVLDGTRWTGVADVGKRVFCGAGAWSLAELYLVTTEVVVDAEGREENIAVPAIG